MIRFLHVVALLCITALSGAQAQPVEQRDVTISIGTWVIPYLPLPLAQAKGYFKDEGINATIQNFQAGGSKALQALVGGSTDTVVGYYDHTISMQAQHKDVRCVILLNALPGEVIAVRKGVTPPITSLKDFKGRKIGVTALGSSTEFQLRYQAGKVGVTPDDMTVVPVGAGPTAIAAVERKAIDAIVTQDPTATVMQRRGLVDILLDARTLDGTLKAFGGRYPTTCLYTTGAYIESHPGTIQHLVNAFARALRFIADNTPADIVAALPPEYVLGDKDTFTEIVEKSRQIFPRVGRFDVEDLKLPRDLLASFDERIRNTTIDFEKTYTNRFVDAAPTQ